MILMYYKLLSRAATLRERIFYKKKSYIKYEEYNKYIIII